MKKTLGDKIIWFLTTVLLSAFLILDTNVYISYILIGFTGLIIIVMVFRYQLKIPIVIDQYQINILLFAVFCLVSSLWARDASAAIGKATTIIEIMICMSVLYAHYSKKDSVLDLLECVRWAGYIVAIYAIAFYGLDTIRMIIAAEGRVDNSFANINAISTAVAVSLVITVFKIVYYGFSATAVFALPEIIMIAAGGSRKALLIVGIGVVLLFMYRYASKNMIKTAIRYIGLAVIFLIVVRIVLYLPIFAGINARMEGLIALITGTGKVEHSAWLRQQYILAGIEQFKKTPILGIGIGNSYYILMEAFGKKTYLHNNFVELLACGGIIGFAFYYYMTLWPLLHIWRNRHINDPCTGMVLILMLVLLAMDFAAVSYYAKSTYFYLMIYYLQAKLLSKKTFEEAE